MKKSIKVISLTLILFAIVGLGTACSLSEVKDFVHGPVPGFETSPDRKQDSDNKPDPVISDEDTTIDLPSEDLVPLTQTPAIPIVLMPVASGSKVESNSKAVIDYSNTADGYVMVKWNKETTSNLFVQITGPDDVRYQYSILPDGNFNVLPLTGGNGSYTINVLEQTSDGRGALVVGTTVKVTLTDEFAPFLRPNQFVNFDEDSEVVKVAASLVSKEYSFPEKIAAVYNFVTSNIVYDTDFAQSVIDGAVSSYIPDLDSVLARGKGICFDYAAVMTAMLRSQGIPTKMVFGYADDVYHAWISVYSDETGWIDQVIFFDGESWMLMDPTFAAAAGSASSLQNFIGDGGVYTALLLY